MRPLRHSAVLIAGDRREPRVRRHPVAFTQPPISGNLHNEDYRRPGSRAPEWPSGPRLMLAGLMSLKSRISDLPGLRDIAKARRDAEWQRETGYVMRHRPGHYGSPIPALNEV